MMTRVDAQATTAAADAYPADPSRRKVVLNLISTHQQGVQVTYLTPQNFTGAFVRQPVFIRECSGDGGNLSGAQEASETNPSGFSKVIYVALLAF